MRLKPEIYIAAFVNVRTLFFLDKIIFDSIIETALWARLDKGELKMKNIQTIRKGDAFDVVLRLENFFSEDILKLPGEIIFAAVGGPPVIKVFDTTIQTGQVSSLDNAHLLSLELGLRAVYDLPGRGQSKQASVIIGPGISLTLNELTEGQKNALLGSLPLDCAFIVNPREQELELAAT